MRTKKENIIDFANKQVTERIHIDMTKDKMYYIICSYGLEQEFLNRLNYCANSIDYIYITGNAYC